MEHDQDSSDIIMGTHLIIRLFVAMLYSAIITLLYNISLSSFLDTSLFSGLIIYSIVFFFSYHFEHLSVRAKSILNIITLSIVILVYFNFLLISHYFPDLFNTGQTDPFHQFIMNLSIGLIALISYFEVMLMFALWNEKQNKEKNPGPRNRDL